MLIADLNEFVYFTDAHQYAAGRAPDGTPYQAVILRATYSTTHIDNRYQTNIAQARAAGLLAGHYGYLAKTDDPTHAGEFFAETVRTVAGGVRPGESIWCDDEETVGGDETPRVTAFLDAAHQALGVAEQAEGVYSGAAFYTAHLASTPPGRRRWIAAYGAPQPALGEQLFQFTDRQQMPGVSGPCDCSIFDGTIEQLAALFTAPADPPPASTVAPAAPIPGDTLMQTRYTTTTGSDGTAYVDLPIPPGCTRLIGGFADVLDATAHTPPRHDADITPTNPSGVVCQPAVDGHNIPAGHQRLRIAGAIPNHFYTGTALFG